MPVERIEPAYDGIDHDSAPDAIAKTRAPLLENFLVDRPGKLPLRGPINESVQVYSGAIAEKPVGVWVHNDNILVGLKANSATATRDPWVAPYRRPTTEAELGVDKTTAYHLNLESGATTSLAVTATTCPGPSYTRLDQYTWGIGYSRDATASRTVNGGRQWDTQLLRWDGTAVAPTAYVNGPVMPQAVKGHLNRLFVGGGLKPGTSTYSPNSLFYSDLVAPGSTPADALTFWQDDVSGLVNELPIDSNDPSDFIVALGKVGRSLAVFKRRSLHILLGETTSTFVVRPISFDVGCLDPRSIIEYQDGVFFMSEQGFMFFDGQQIINVSEDLRSTLLAEALRVVGDRGVDGGRVVSGKLPNSYVAVSIGETPATSASSVMTICGLFHPPRSSWVELSSNALTCQRPIALGRSLTRTYLLDDQRLVQANHLTAPETAEEATRGYDTAASIFTFDTSGGGPLFNGTGNALKNQISLVNAWLSQTNAPILARWHSRLAKLAQSFHASVVRRLAVDYSFEVDGGTDDLGDGWTVSLVDGRGNVLLVPTAVPVQGDPSTHAYRRQFLVDINTEAEDAQLRVEYTGAATAIKDAAVFNAAVEFEPAQRRPSR